MGGFVIDRRGGCGTAMTFDQIQVLTDAGYGPLFALSSEEIRDRSKADPLGKLIAMSQALWPVVQVAARPTQHLSTSTLELTTIAFVACGIFTSLFWWRQPLDIQLPTRFVLDDVHHHTHETVLLLNKQLTTSRGSILKDTLASILEPIAEERSSTWQRLLSTSILAAAFGRLHCIAIPWAFPTNLESTLWTFASLFTSIVPGALLLIFYAGLKGERDKKRIRWDDVLRFVTIALFLVVYSFSRCYLLFEPFCGLRSLPASAFGVLRWAAWLPHVH